MGDVGAALGADEEADGAARDGEGESVERPPIRDARSFASLDGGADVGAGAASFGYQRVA